MNFVLGNISHPVIFYAAGRFISPENWIHSERKLESHELIIMLKGKLFIQQGDEKYILSKGDMLFLLPGFIHKGYARSEKGTSFYWFHFAFKDGYRLVSRDEAQEKFSIHRAGNYLSVLNESVLYGTLLKGLDMERVGVLCNQILHIYQSQYYSEMGAAYLMTSLLLEITEQSIKKSATAAERGKLYTILEWIRINSYQNISLRNVAYEFNYSKEYLSRYFKKCMKISVQQYINQVKVSRAKELLCETDIMVKEIAQNIGFEDEKYFMKLFKQHENMTPKQFRNAYCRTHLNND